LERRTSWPRRSGAPRTTRSLRMGDRVRACSRAKPNSPISRRSPRLGAVSQRTCSPAGSRLDTRRQVVRFVLPNRSCGATQCGDNLQRTSRRRAASMFMTRESIALFAFSEFFIFLFTTARGRRCSRMSTLGRRLPQQSRIFPGRESPSPLGPGSPAEFPR
jgi:hypothetical protein